MPITVIEGEQRGDEGKGRYVDLMMPEYDIGARYNGGDNAGHTIVSETGEIYKVHSLPSSIVHESKTSVIGNGTVVNPLSLEKEITILRDQGIEISELNLLISSAAHLITPIHVSLDEIREAGEGRQGSTKSGIAFAYSDKSRREGIQVAAIKNRPQELREHVESGLRHHRWSREVAGLDPINERAVALEYVEAAQRLGDFITDTSLYLNRQLRKDKPARVLAEGAQAYLLDIDHGMYPDTTSSTTIAAGACSGLGVATGFIERTMGVIKAIPSHVGGGHFVTEVTEPDRLRQLHGDMEATDAEKGTTTGRIRRLGILDLPQLRRAIMISDPDDLGLTKYDWVSRQGPKIPVCTGYYRKGKYIEIAPDAAYKLEQCEPDIEYLDGWQEDIREVRKFSDLPTAAQHYWDYLEIALAQGLDDRDRIPIIGAGVGPARDQIIIRR